MSRSDRHSEFHHLHLHTTWSAWDGAVRIPELVREVALSGARAVAVTDHGTMAGLPELALEARAAGVRPIFGCEVYVVPGLIGACDGRGKRHLVLLARTDEGFENLAALQCSACRRDGPTRPRITKSELAARSAGLIALSACLGGEIPRAICDRGLDEARRVTAEYAALFEPGSFYLELQQAGFEGQREVNEALRRIGREQGLPIVATNDVHYLRAGDFRAHEVLMCLKQGTTLDDPSFRRFYTSELFLRNREQMFEALPGFPTAVDHAAEVASSCYASAEVLTSRRRPADCPCGPELACPAGFDELRRQRPLGLEKTLRAVARAMALSIDSAEVYAVARRLLGAIKATAACQNAPRPHVSLTEERSPTCP